MFLIFWWGILLPSAGAAVRVEDVLHVPENHIVSRGEFIRSTVILFGLSVEEGKRTRLPFNRPVPPSLLPYLQAAQERKALMPFGNELMQARGITRAEAVEFIVILRNFTPRDATKRFGDIEHGTSAERAVQVAFERGWLDPLRENVFGGKRVLTGREGKLLLQRVLGEAPVSKRNRKDVPVVHIMLETGTGTPLPQEDIMRATWKLLKGLFLHQEKLEESTAGYAAVEALVKSVGDPYTTFMRPVSSKEFQTQIQGEVSGIGAQVEYIDGILTIVAPLPKSPAEVAGLLPGDQILSVDGESVKDVGFLEAISKVRGPKGSTAKLHLRRSGIELDISVVRDVVRVPEIEVSTVNGVAVIKIIQFGQTSEKEFRRLAQEAQESNPRGIILDLRNDPGGLLSAASVVVSAFLPEGSTVAKIVGLEGTYNEVTNAPPVVKKEMPLVVLVNKGSASASEIVAGALQDKKRATILGEKTFGKGTVQQVVDFRDGSSLKLTVAEWMTPDGRKIEGKGVDPDIVVEKSDGRDEQMLRAMELFR